MAWPLSNRYTKRLALGDSDPSKRTYVGEREANWRHLNAACSRVSGSAPFPFFVFLTLPPFLGRLFILLVGQWATGFLFV